MEWSLVKIKCSEHMPQSIQLNWKISHTMEWGVLLIQETNRLDHISTLNNVFVFLKGINIIFQIWEETLLISKYNIQAFKDHIEGFIPVLNVPQEWTCFHIFQNFTKMYICNFCRFISCQHLVFWFRYKCWRWQYLYATLFSLSYINLNCYDHNLAPFSASKSNEKPMSGKILIFSIQSTTVRSSHLWNYIDFPQREERRCAMHESTMWAYVLGNKAIGVRQAKPLKVDFHTRRTT